MAGSKDISKDLGPNYALPAGSPWDPNAPLGTKPNVPLEYPEAEQIEKTVTHDPDSSDFTPDSHFYDYLGFIPDANDPEMEPNRTNGLYPTKTYMSPDGDWIYYFDKKVNKWRMSDAPQHGAHKEPDEFLGKRKGLTSEDLDMLKGNANVW